jgi:predicted DNA binding CopG/RHH family protein
MKRAIKQVKPFDKEEKSFMDAENAYKSLPRAQLNAMRKRLVNAAKNTNTNRKLVSLRVREDDLAVLKHEAEAKGLGYQTLINSILHQYVTGHLKAI